ncbi:MAG: type VI secretion system tube protein TssD [Planctomycetota bacterium]
MANAFYIKVNGETQGELKGDVEQENREGMIRGYSFSNSTTIPRHADSGQPTGTRTHHPVVFSKHVDCSSPLLWQAMTKGERLTEVVFDFYKISPSGENTNYYSVRLQNAIIVEMQTELMDTSGATGTQSEEVREHLHLTYETIEWENKDAGTMSTDSWRTT